MSMKRDDITIAIDTDGNVWAAQGGPANELLQERDIATAEHSLYYSQLPHRAAWRDEDGELTVGLPSESPADAMIIGRQHGMTTTPKIIGRV